ncbi:hypothetical protein KKE54_07050, partial [bacterium]|nr:hypothetical protein [bacterium]
YVGPKPVITKSGITFAAEYDDRYTYLNILIQLLYALDKDHFEDKTYQYAIDSKRLNDEELLAGLQHYCGNFEDVLSESIAIENTAINSEIKHVKENDTMDAAEKEALVRNLEVMRNYRLQYATNDTLYNCAVNALAKLIKKEHIDYVIVPMFQRFAAVLHSVQDELMRQNFPIQISMEIYEENGKLMAKMEVKNR